MSWGDVYYSTYLTKWVTHDPSTGVRATTSLRGERAHQRCLFSPLPLGSITQGTPAALHTVCLQIFPHSPQNLLAIRQVFLRQFCTL